MMAAAMAAVEAMVPAIGDRDAEREMARATECGSHGESISNGGSKSNGGSDT